MYASSSHCAHQFTTVKSNHSLYQAGLGHREGEWQQLKLTASFSSSILVDTNQALLKKWNKMKNSEMYPIAHRHSFNTTSLEGSHRHSRSPFPRVCSWPCSLSSVTPLAPLWVFNGLHWIPQRLGIFLILLHFESLKVKVAHSCLTLSTPWTILQARIIGWVAFHFSRGSSQSRDQTQVSHIAGRFFTRWDIREAQEYWSG